MSNKLLPRIIESTVVDVSSYYPISPITHFEAKFAKVGCPLYQIKLSLGKRDLNDRQSFLQSICSLRDEEENILTID